MDSLKKWMQDSANILFDDSKNDLRSLPKAVRLQILLVLSFIWTTVFSLYVFSYTTFAFGWAGTYLAHVGLIFAVYMTFKQFHKAEEKSTSVFQTKNFDPFKIMVIVFVIVFIFVYRFFACCFFVFSQAFCFFLNFSCAFLFFFSS